MTRPCVAIVVGRAGAGVVVSAGGSLVGVLVHYQDSGGTLYQPATSQPVDASVTITEITASRVRGTFTANLLSSGQVGLAVTDGQFLVARTN